MTILSLLQSVLVKDILASGRSIFTTSKTAHVSEALKVMTKHKILSMPVWDERRECFCGMVDMQDLVCYFIACLNECDGDVDASAPTFDDSTISHAMNKSQMDVFSPIEEDVALYHVIEIFTRNVHRLPVLDSSGELTNIISQSNVIQFLSKNIDSFGPFKDQSVKALKIIDKATKMNESATALECLSKMKERFESSLYIENEEHEKLVVLALLTLEA
eukprot:CAMPEP_0174252410 /NCGR_PEP_ID=MMETSP0439-20130205/1891_1 /TAXON_ID=0 /ORGANISM="Stereomyxa ramosa, Strain Chinc5" /LENGTH=217 /DNA_ID=CAMNT_0015332937 /DNA_START=19 /DNA_END=673 /DNA_ORIENTATION=+